MMMIRMIRIIMMIRMMMMDKMAKIIHDDDMISSRGTPFFLSIGATALESD